MANTNTTPRKFFPGTITRTEVLALRASVYDCSPVWHLCNEALEEICYTPGTASLEAVCALLNAARALGAAERTKVEE